MSKNRGFLKTDSDDAGSECQIYSSVAPEDEKGYRRKTKRELEKATETNGVRQETFHDLIFRGELSWTKKSLLNFYFILFFLFIY